MDAHQETDRRIAEMVRACYWDRDINCARTTLYCMSRLFDLPRTRSWTTRPSA